MSEPLVRFVIADEHAMVRAGLERTELVCVIGAVEPVDIDLR